MTKPAPGKNLAITVAGGTRVLCTTASHTFASTETPVQDTQAIVADGGLNWSTPNGEPVSSSK
jgi:hypothetical protein